MTKMRLGFSRREAAGSAVLVVGAGILAGVPGLIGGTVLVVGLKGYQIVKERKERRMKSTEQAKIEEKSD